MKKSLDEFNSKKKINIFELQDSDQLKKERYKRNGYGTVASLDRSLAPINNQIVPFEEKSQMSST